jgi:hypothetical protein
MAYVSSDYTLRSYFIKEAHYVTLIQLICSRLNGANEPQSDARAQNDYQILQIMEILKVIPLLPAKKLMWTDVLKHAHQFPTKPHLTSQHRHIADWYGSPTLLFNEVEIINQTRTPFYENYYQAECYIKLVQLLIEYILIVFLEQNHRKHPFIKPSFQSFFGLVTSRLVERKKELSRELSIIKGNLSDSVPIILECNRIIHEEWQQDAINSQQPRPLPRVQLLAKQIEHTASSAAPQPAGRSRATDDKIVVIGGTRYTRAVNGSLISVDPTSTNDGPPPRAYYTAASPSYAAASVVAACPPSPTNYGHGAAAAPHSRSPSPTRGDDATACQCHIYRCTEPGTEKQYRHMGGAQIRCQCWCHSGW